MCMFQIWSHWHSVYVFESMNKFNNIKHVTLKCDLCYKISILFTWNEACSQHFGLSQTRHSLQSSQNNAPKITCLKVLSPIPQNGVFYLNDATSPKKSWYQISVKTVKPFRNARRLCIIEAAYTLVCKLNYGYHN